MNGKLNAGRAVPGMDNIRPVTRRPHTPAPAASQESPVIPRKNMCPFGLECRLCKISVHKDGKLECSIKLLAEEAVKEGIKISGRS